jgi:hypothetical protein
MRLIEIPAAYDGVGFLQSAFCEECIGESQLLRLQQNLNLRADSDGAVGIQAQATLEWLVGVGVRILDGVEFVEGWIVERNVGRRNWNTGLRYVNR